MNLFASVWFPLLPEEFSLRLVLTLLHFLWQGVAVGAVVLIINWRLKSASPADRYLVHTIALLSLPVLMVVTFCLTEVPANWRVKFKEPESSVALNSSPVNDQISLHESGSPLVSTPQPMRIGEGENVPLVPVATRDSLDSPHQTTLRETSGGSASGSSTHSVSPLIPTRTMICLVTGLYVLGVCGFLLRLLMAMWGGHRLRSASDVIEKAELLDLVNAQAESLGLKLTPTIALCERVAGPVVMGILRPIVLLPSSITTGLTQEQFAAILRHELAHIRRHDLLVNLLQRVVESLLFFHPVVWFLSRKMNDEREACCDDLVVSSGSQPAEYADALLRMAELCSPSKSADAPALAASGNHTSQLESRIWRLLNMDGETRLHLTRATAMVIVLLILPVVLTPLMVRSVVEAQIAPSGITSQPPTAPPKVSPTSPIEEEELIPVPPVDPQIQKLPLEQRISTTHHPLWVKKNIGMDPLFLDNNRLLVGHSVLDLKSGKQLEKLATGKVELTFATLSANGRFLLTCGYIPPRPSTFLDFIPSVIQVWDAKTLKQTGSTIRVGGELFLNAVRSSADVSSDGNHVVIGDRKGVFLWNVKTGQQTKAPITIRGYTVDAVRFSPDTNWLVVSDRNDLTYWKWQTKEPPRTIHVGRKILSLAFTPDSRYLAEGPDSRSGIELRELSTLNVVRTFQDEVRSPLYVRENAIQFSTDGKSLIAGNAVMVDQRKLKIPHRLHIWDTDSGKLLHQIATPSHQIYSLSLSPDGSRLAARLGSGNDSMLVVWALKPLKVTAKIQPGMTFQQVIAIKGRHYRPVHGMREGQLILTYDDISVYIENYHMGNEERGRVSRVDPTPLDSIEEYLKAIPYADAEDEQPNLSNPQRNPDPKIEPQAETNTSPEKGLEFLAKYPKLHKLSLKMTEAEFLKLVARENLKLHRSPDGPTYSIPTGDGHLVLVMFGNNGDKCSGIQRIRGTLE